MSVSFDPKFIDFSKAGGSTLLTNLVSYWKLNETAAGANAVDEKGITTLTNNGCTTNQTGLLGKAFLFTKASSNYLGPVDTTYEYANNFSVGCWFKTTTSGSAMYLVSDYYYDGHGWVLYIDSDNIVSFECWDSAQTPTDALAYSSQTAFDGGWHLAVGTFDGTYTRIYIDGSLRGTSTAWAHNVAYAVSSAFTVGSDEGIQLFFDGTIDEVAIWNKVLTLTEVQEWYNSGTGKTYPF